MNEILIGLLPIFFMLTLLGIGFVALRIVDWFFERKDR